MIPSSTVSPFRSFWMGGFECADHLNAFGNRVDLLATTGHVTRLDRDYDALSEFNIATVREGIRWTRVEVAPYTYDWSVVRRMMESARERGIQQVWDICHFGFPDDLTPLHPMFPRRFAALCAAFARFYRSVDATSQLIVTPINEVGFLSWLGGDVRGTSPYCIGQGWEVKYRLMKAYIEGIEALRIVDPGIRILTTEPLVHITSELGADPAEQRAARICHEEQFQVLDILSGRICPELRGDPSYLDILGFNFYYNNQWIHTTHEMLVWTRQHTDLRWRPLHQLLQETYVRYGRPIVLAETSHPKEDRPRWVESIARECLATLESGVPLWGICWYPIVDRPDWDNLTDWHHAGLWDRAESGGAGTDRILHRPTAAALHLAQARLAQCALAASC